MNNVEFVSQVFKDLKPEKYQELVMDIMTARKSHNPENDFIAKKKHVLIFAT